MSRSFVLTPSTVLPSGATSAILTTDGSLPYPSGTPVQAFIDEELNFADGRLILDPPFATDLLVYRTLDGASGIVSFRLSPTVQATTATLRDGTDHIRIVDYPGRIDRGAMIGSEGGRLAGGDDAISIDLPAGATTEALRASVAPISKAELASFGTIAGFDIAAGFALTLARADDVTTLDGSALPPAQLLKSARGTFTLDVARTRRSSSARLSTRRRIGTLVRLAALTSAISTSGALRSFTTRAIDVAQLPLEGIVRPGRYLVLVARAPIAFAFGQVRAGTSGAFIADARVVAGIGAPQTAQLGVVDISRSGGVFAIPVAASPAQPFSLIARTSGMGDSGAALAPKAPDPGEIVSFGTLALIPNAPRLVSIAPADGSVINATDPFAPRATFDAPIDPASVANGISIVNAVTGKLDGRNRYRQRSDRRLQSGRGAASGDDVRGHGRAVDSRDQRRRIRPDSCRAILNARGSVDEHRHPAGADPHHHPVGRPLHDQRPRRRASRRIAGRRRSSQPHVRDDLSGHRGR